MNISTHLIDSLLQQADIEGLLELGAPSDEYYSEAEIVSLALAKLGKNEITAENVATIISEVWKASFNVEGSDLEARKTNINNLAEMIIQNRGRIFT